MFPCFRPISYELYASYTVLLVSYAEITCYAESGHMFDGTFVVLGVRSKLELDV